MCLAQGHNAVMPVRLEPAALRSRIKHSTTEPLRSLYPDQNRRSVGTELGPNYLQMLSADKERGGGGNLGNNEYKSG